MFLSPRKSKKEPFMAMKKAYNDAFGNSYTDSYWRIVQINIGVADNTGMVVFYGYKDAASRAANKQSIGSKSYSLTKEEFQAMMVQHLTPGGPNLMQALYTYAKNKHDTPAPTPEEPDKKVSFFADAVDDI